MARRNHTAGERAVAIIGVMSGKTLDDINNQLEKDQEHIVGTKRKLNPRSYDLLRRAYAPHIAGIAGGTPLSVWQEAWDHITAPKTMGEL